MTVHNHELSLSRIIECLNNNKLQIVDIAKREPSLEEAFLKLIGEASARESGRVEKEVERLRKEIVEAIDKIKVD
jgi:tellurite resistance protein